MLVSDSSIDQPCAIGRQREVVPRGAGIGLPEPSEATASSRASGARPRSVRSMTRHPL
jgi:hypothetical protein